MKMILNICTGQTGLQKLTREQLIDIILRKDDKERKLSAEVKKLKMANRQLTEVIEEMNSLLKN